MLDQSLFLRALNKKTNSVPPIWYMRQAGRYLPEYRAVRSKFKNFLDMCKNPDVCCELALQPIDRFNLDASILFSDILTIPDAFNLGVEFKEGEGPVFNNPIRNIEAIANLPSFDPQELSYVYKCVSNIRGALPTSLPLIGFCGSPWTLAAYSIEGGSSKDFAFTRNFISENPKETQHLLGVYTDACFEYLKEQVLAGIDAIQIFDSWAGLLGKEDYKVFSLNYINDLVQQLKEDDVTKDTPVIIFARQPKGGIEQLSACKPECISLYWDESIEDSIHILKGNTAIQGNLNPLILKEENSIIYNELKIMLDKFKDYPGYIFNLGHGITPDINPDKIKFVTDTVREL
jgi:uroporphyrinogen decarboxylase|tara:strand:- start:20459 stop:21496 length:1038 start_codon:yes stop_codon:yes gene_type:complete